MSSAEIRQRLGRSIFRSRVIVLSSGHWPLVLGGTYNTAVQGCETTRSAFHGLRSGYRKLRTILPQPHAFRFALRASAKVERVQKCMALQFTFVVKDICTEGTPQRQTTCSPTSPLICYETTKFVAQIAICICSPHRPCLLNIYSE